MLDEIFGGSASKLSEVTVKLQKRERANQDAIEAVQRKDAEIKSLQESMEKRIAEVEQATIAEQAEAANAQQEAAAWRLFGESQQKALEVMDGTTEALDRKAQRDQERLQGMDQAIRKAERIEADLTAMESLRAEAVDHERRSAGTLEWAEGELKELRETGLRAQRELDRMRSARAEAFAKMEAAEKVVAYSKKEGFDFQRFGDRTQREMEITLAAKGVLERRLTELGPQLTAASEELATTKMKLRSLRAAQAESEERLAPLACENGSMASELEQLRASEGQARAELTELREASALERAHLLQEAGSWKEFAKRNQVEMEMYVGKKVAQFGQAVAALNDVQQEPFPLKLTAVGVAT